MHRKCGIKNQLIVLISTNCLWQVIKTGKVYKNTFIYENVCYNHSKAIERKADQKAANMKKTQWKDSIRNIRKEKISFISIAIIALLAVASYLGINFTSEAMRQNADNFYRKTHFRDLEISSTMLLGEEDLQSLPEMTEVADAEGIYMVNAKVSKQPGHENVSVVSLTERINTPELVEGRLPENERECVLESDLAAIIGGQVGERLRVSDAQGKPPAYLKESEFLITGIVYHADLYTLKSQSPGNRYIIVSPGAFDKEAFGNSYMKALVKIGKPEGLSYFSEEYKNLAAAAMKKIETWSKEREIKREAAIRNTAAQSLTASKKQLAEAEGQLREGRAALVKMAKGLDSLGPFRVIANPVLDALKAGLAENAEKLEEGRGALLKAEKELAAMAPCRFVCVDTQGNASFVTAEDSAVSIGNLGKTFAALFILLGALVIYATVGRIIDEQRSQVGTQKALGFFSREVFQKHLAFGAAATCIGIIAGVAAGYWMVQTTVLAANEPFYVMKKLPRVIRWDRAGIILVLGIVLAGLAVFWACSHLLREAARDLMQAPVPKGRKKAETKRSERSLYSRLIVRNMLTDWKRVLITMASVAGCCILLVIGFTLKNSIVDAVDRQFSRIILNKEKISYDTDSFASAEQEIENALQRAGIDYMKISSRYQTLSSPEGLTAAELIVVEADRTDAFLHLSDPKTGEVISPPGEGILITRRISEVYGLAPGDSFTIYNGNMEPYETKVAGVFEYYLGKSMIISREAYRALFGTDAAFNAFWTRGAYEEEALRCEISQIQGFESVENTADTRSRYMESTASLQSITFLLIQAAGMMAFFVLLNLINMHLNQKKKELTIMRVNGFTTKDVIRYVAGEGVLTTCLGIVLGLLLGSALGYSIVRLLEQVQFGLVRSINLPAWIYAALLTGAFALVIHVIALRKVKQLKLTDIA